MALIYAVCIAVLQGQTIETKWIRNYGGTNWDENYASIINNKGNLVITGYTESTDIDITSNAGAVDVWVAEIDSNGNIIWENSFGGSSVDLCFSILETSNLEYLIYGITYSTDGDFADYFSDVDAFIIEIDSLGNKLWSKNYGGSEGEAAYVIKEDIYGNFIVAMGSSSNDGQVSGHHGSTEYGDVWLCKIDPDGNILWDNSYGSYYDDYPADLCITPENHVVVAAVATANGGDVSGHHGWEDVWAFEIDSSGNLLWQSCYGGSESDEARAIQTTSNGYLISSKSYSDDGDIYGHNGSADAWLIHIDSVGNLLSQKCIGGTGADGLYSLMQLNNQYLACGFTNSESGAITNVYDDEDIWFVVFDSLLNIESQYFFGGYDTEYGHQILADSNDHIYITGWTESTDIDFPDAYGGRDIFAIKLEICNNKYYADADGDGFGHVFTDSLACSAPPGFVADSTDCNDADAGVYPLATDICNDLDDNCNGLIDEDATFTLWYADIDGDGFGLTDTDSLACAAPVGYVAFSNDCDDTNPAIYPGAAELCNDLDDDCDALSDEDLLLFTLFADADGDTYGDASSFITSCLLEIVGYVTDSTDCVDTNPAIYPGAEEICNYLDDDCDGLIDDNLFFSLQYADNDNDNYGDIAIDTLACLDIPGFVSDSTDCDDTNPNIYPGAIELLNGIDDDCDGINDDGLNLSDTTEQHIAIFPNPSTGGFTLLHPACSGSRFIIVDAVGQKIQSGFCVNTMTPIVIEVISAGVYTCTWTCGAMQYSTPVIILK